MRFFRCVIISISAIYGAYGQQVADTVKLDTLVILDKYLIDVPYVASRVDQARLSTANTRDVGDFLRGIPNVSGIRKGGVSIDPVVRGFKYSQLNVFISDGIKVENGCPNRMDPVSSHIEAEDIQNIEVTKGPFALKYGPVFGGMINLAAEKPEPNEKFEIHAKGLVGYESNWNGHKEHLSVNGGGRKVYFLVSGGHRSYGDYHSGDINGKDSTFRSSFEKYNYSVKLGFSPMPDHNFNLSYDRIHSKNVMYPALSMDENSDDARIISVDYNAKNLGKSIKTLVVKLYQSDVHHVMDNSKRPSYALMQMVADVDAVNTGGRTEVNMQFAKHRLVAGVDYENIFKDGKRTGTMIMDGIPTTRISNLWNHALIQNAGLFAEYSTAFPAFDIKAVIRGDINQATSEDTLVIVEDGTEYFNDVNSGFFNLSASFGITEHITDWFSVSLSAGRGTRSPNMLERYIKLLPVGYDNYDYLGNPQLEPETNNEVDLTFNLQHENMGGIQLNGFYSYVQNYITANLLPPSVILPQTQGVLGVKQFENADHVTFTGFEFGYATPERYPLGGSIIAAYTYAVIPSVTKYLISGNQVTGDTIIYDDALPEIPPFETTISVYGRLAKGNLVPKISIRAVAGQNHTSEAFYEPSTPGFVLMNISANYNIGKHIRLLGGINNIFDRAYYEHLNRKIIGTTGKLYEPGRSLFINISVNI